MNWTKLSDKTPKEPGLYLVRYVLPDTEEWKTSKKVQYYLGEKHILDQAEIVNVTSFCPDLDIRCTEVAIRGLRVDLNHTITHWIKIEDPDPGAA